ncbi:MAG: glucose-6-phosphate isomerase, partial [Armatimonadetes bacterium]|nr:glucose-6-phosphate isomerase [Armatimonadota bacterium]
MPEDIGGRFSVLTEVGFFPLKAAGIDIREILKGARTCANLLKEENLEKNPAYLYAGIRYLLYQKKKIIEILATFSPKLQAFSEWWTQLFGESEGKNHKGIFPARATFSTDLHSLGQLIQEGTRNIFETFLMIEKEDTEIKIPESELNLDNLNYLKDKSLNYINEQAFKGTA